MLFCALWPAGKIQSAILELEDHWGAVHHIRHQTKPPPRLQEETVDWPQFIAKASKDVFSNWKKVHHYWHEGPLWNALALFITFNAVCFGLLIFSGHIGATPNAQRTFEKVSTLNKVP